MKLVYGFYFKYWNAIKIFNEIQNIINIYICMHFTKNYHGFLWRNHWEHFQKKLFEMSGTDSVICIVYGPRVCGFSTHNFMLQVLGLFIYISNSPLSPVIILGKGDYWASLSTCLRKHVKVMSYLQVTAFIMQARSQHVSSHVTGTKRTAIYWGSGKLGSLKM